MLQKVLNDLLYSSPTILWTAGIIASIIIFVIWIFVAFNIKRNMDDKIDFSIADEVENKTGIYMVSALFWPAALVMGNTFLKKPGTAQTGRTCIIIFLWFSTFVVLLSITTVLTAIAYMPDIIEFFKNHGLL